MSRYAPRPSFDPAASYVAVRRLLLNGRQYEPGDLLELGELHIRRVQSLYDAKRIAMVRPATVQVADRELAPGEVLEDAADVAEIQARLDAMPPEERAALVGALAETEGGETSPDAPPRSSDVPGGPAGETASPEEAPASAPAPRVVKVGMGGWQVVNAEGAPVGSSHRTKKAAEAALQALVGG